MQTRKTTRILTFITILLQYHHVRAFVTQPGFNKFIDHCQISSCLRLPQFRILISRKNAKIETQRNDYDESDLTVTVEDTLLACRAYLQRKNRLGWAEYEDRKKLARRSLALASPPTYRSKNRNFNSSTTNTNSGVGYFWEDPNELKYLRKSRNLTSFDENEEYSEDVFYLPDDEESQELDGFYNPSIGNVGGGQEDYEEEENRRMDVWGFPMYPSDERKRRSESRKKLFQNAEFKAKWYEKRWGATSRSRAHSNQEIAKKRKQKLVQKIPSEILDSPELAALSDEEIDEAIETYKKANKRRSESFRKRAEARKIIEDSRYERNLKLQTGVGKKLANEDSSVEEFSSVPNDETQASSLTFFPDKSDMRELQLSRLKRSRRAAKAYQTRRENIAKKASTNVDISEKSNASSPYHIIQIRKALESNKLPSILDVEKVMEPIRLSGRRGLLIDILVQCFKMKGECVPKLSTSDKKYNDNVDYPAFKLMSKSTVRELGEFVMFKLKESAMKNKEDSTSCESTNMLSNPFLIRIRQSIDSNEYPLISDVEKVMKVKRMAGRKDVLIDILMECFNLRGKCVPKIIHQDGNINYGDTLEFITESTVQELGAFAISKLRETLLTNNNYGAESLSTVRSSIHPDPSYTILLDRIRTSIESNEYPSISDVEKVMKPKRLPGRKDVFADVLIKVFKMKGKCVPKLGLMKGSEHGYDELEFISKSTVREIGTFIIHMIKEKVPSNQKEKTYA